MSKYGKEQKYFSLPCLKKLAFFFFTNPYFKSRSHGTSVILGSIVFEQRPKVRTVKCFPETRSYRETLIVTTKHMILREPWSHATPWEGCLCPGPEASQVISFLPSHSHKEERQVQRKDMPRENTKFSETKVQLKSLNLAPLTWGWNE